MWYTPNGAKKLWKKSIKSICKSFFVHYNANRYENSRNQTSKYWRKKYDVVFDRSDQSYLLCDRKGIAYLCTCDRSN